MDDDDSGSLDRLAARLLVQGSRFSRSMSRHTGEQRSLVAMRVLSNLLQDGPLRIGELAARELIAQPAMTTTVNRLEAEGLVFRGSDAEDARASVVTLTEAGSAVLMSFRARAAAIARPGLVQLADSDIAVLERAADLLEQLVRSISSR